MRVERKSRAFNPSYESPGQLSIEGFETPFARHLRSDNRWVVLAGLIPRDEIVSVYPRNAIKYHSGGKPLNPRIVTGSLIIKHILNLDDRETVAQIAENVYLQYFPGYSSFISEEPFDASLFVDLRHTLGDEVINTINEKIVQLKRGIEERRKKDSNGKQGDNHDIVWDAQSSLERSRSTEQKVKPRTCRKEARKEYLHRDQKKNRSKKDIRKAVGKQLRYLKRDIAIIRRLLDSYSVLPFRRRQLKYFYVIQTLYDQQKEMFDSHTHRIEHRIVSIHQPHVRPTVRGKAQAKVEFGAKIHVTMINGIIFLDEISWDAFNEGSHLEDYLEQCRSRHKCYPKELSADKIYCTRTNRAMLKIKGITLRANPLGRPSPASALLNHVSPGEGNPIEGKFGQAKAAYGMNRIKARLKDTSQSWIASIVPALNLVRLAGTALLCLIVKMAKRLTVILYEFNSKRINYWETDRFLYANMGKIGVSRCGI